MAKYDDDIRVHLEKQVSDLKKEMGRMRHAIGARASDVMDGAEDRYESLRENAADMARQLREQASVARDVARENPGTTATVLTTVGLVGFFAGLMVAGMCAGSDRR